VHIHYLTQFLSEPVRNSWLHGMRSFEQGGSCSQLRFLALGELGAVLLFERSHDWLSFGSFLRSPVGEFLSTGRKRRFLPDPIYKLLCFPISPPSLRSRA
jgi:hypothetical protein